MSEEQRAPIRVVLRLTDVQPDEEGYVSLSCQVAMMSFRVEQSFGPHAQYKGRGLVHYTEVVPQNAGLVVKIPSDRVTQPADVVIQEMAAAIFSHLVVGVEVAVEEAEARFEARMAEIVRKLEEEEHQEKIEASFPNVFGRMQDALERQKKVDEEAELGVPVVQEF